MNKIFPFILSAILLSAIGCNKIKETNDAAVANEIAAKTPLQLGKELFEGTGKCFSCHKPDQSIVGPSIVKIATIYKEQKGDMVSFLKGEENPLVDPSQYEVMKVNIEITKKLTDKELIALEAYMYSFLVSH